ncbi:MAG: HPr kinase/phosphorylase, partial [Pseudomonadota bacterium]
MTTPPVTAYDFFEAQSGPLKLKWIAGETGKNRLLEPTTAKYPGMALVGHLNFVHPNRIQVIGEAEI